MSDNISLVNICVNKTLEVYLEKCDTHTLQQLKMMNHDQRITFFENNVISIYPLNTLLADRYTLLNDYPDIISQLFTFTLTDLHSIINHENYSKDKNKFPSDTIDTIRSKDVICLSILLERCNVDMFTKTLQNKVLSTIVMLSFFIEIVNLGYNSKLQESINNIKLILPNATFNSVPLFRSRAFNIIDNIEHSIDDTILSQL